MDHTYKRIMKSDLERIINNRKSINNMLKIRLKRNISDCPEGSNLWTAMLSLVNVWDNMIFLEELKTSDVDFNNPEEVETRFKEIKNTFSNMKFQREKKY